VKEIWLVLGPEKQIEVHRRPEGGEYAEQRLFGPGGRVVCEELPAFAVDLDALFSKYRFCTPIDIIGVSQTFARYASIESGPASFLKCRSWAEDEPQRARGAEGVAMLWPHRCFRPYGMLQKCKRSARVG